MTIKTFALTSSMALCSLFGGLVSAQAGELGQHPAVLIQQHKAAIDPNVFIVGHPAGLALRSGRANFDHPAVVIARNSQPRIDTNTFIVQPPTSVAWVVTPAAAAQSQMADLGQDK